MSSQYEFTQEQNTLIGSLAGKMNFVGLFLNIMGIFNILVALFVVAAIYRAQVPKEWVANLPDEVRTQAEKVPFDKLPPDNHLWGIVLNVGVVGVFYLLLGTWTRTSAKSFQQIVDTQGRDISHLMNALVSLHNMYSLVYTLLMVTLLLSLIGLFLSLYLSFLR